MNRFTVSLIGVIVGVIAIPFLLRAASARFDMPYPAVHEMVITDNGLQDTGLTLMGFRSVAADIAWVQMLQYVGGAPFQDNPEQAYPKLKQFAIRITRLDPSLTRAYLFAAGMLAWSLERPEEAVSILEEGIRRHPTYWPLRSYLAAIAYKNDNQFEKMAELLADLADQPDAPTMVKSILANAYKKQGRYRDAIRIWEIVLAGPDDGGYHARARRQIHELNTRLYQKKL